MAGKFLLVSIESEAERSAFNVAFSTSAHRPVYSLSDQDLLLRLTEIRPDLVVLPISQNQDLGPLTLQISALKKEPCGEDVPILLYQRGPKAPDDVRKILKAVGASAFLPWPPKEDIISKAVTVLVLDSSTDSHVSIPVLEEEATAEITVNQIQDNFIDPVLFAAAVGLDEHDDEMPTNPRQSLSEIEELEIKVEVQTAEADVAEDTAAKHLLSALPSIKELSPSAEEKLPVFSVPSDFENTPSIRQESLLAENVLRSDSSISLPEFLIEPELPNRDTGQSKVSETARKRIEEIELSNSKSEISISEIRSVPANPAPGNASELATRKGLDESRLGKRLIRRIEKTHDALESLTYYDLLGVDPSVTDRVLRDAYFGLSLEFHPDRFFLMTSGSLKEKIYVIFRRINEAYSVLSDATLRSDYDQSLLAKKQGVDTINSSAPPPGKRDAAERQSDPAFVSNESSNPQTFLEKAQKAFQERDYDGARLYLRFAAKLEPENSAIREALNKVESRLPPLNPTMRW
ncbi:MAG: J domain-containing protein [Myxococcota bacterium]|nr:J domain-containing protein [Myxococcota bacterium]